MINVAFIPSSKIFLKNSFFSGGERDDVLEPFRRLKTVLGENGININTHDIYTADDKIDVLLVSRYEVNIKTIFKIFKKNPNVRIIMLMTEEINVAPLHSKKIFDSDFFDIVMTWRDDYVDDVKYQKYYYPNPVRVLSEVRDYENKKLCVMINSFKKHAKGTAGDLYFERMAAIEYFSQYSDIDLYGLGWGKSKNILINSVYCGELVEKIPALRKYKFSLVFENSNNDIGGITEKIFDVMAAGCVPVYWGAPNVEDYLPGGCYIDYRKFSGYKELNEFIKTMSEDQYEDYIRNIRKFLGSEDYKKFTSDYFALRILENINKVLQMPERKYTPHQLKRDLIKRVFFNCSNYAYLHRYRRLIFELLMA